MEIICNYFLFILLFQPIEELYNCNNPNTIGENLHLLCNWQDVDFVVNSKGNRVLKKYKQDDNFIKAHYRRKYWSNNDKNR